MDTLRELDLPKPGETLGTTQSRKNRLDQTWATANERIETAQREGSQAGESRF